MPELRFADGLGLSPFGAVAERLKGTPLEALGDDLARRSAERLLRAAHGDLADWLGVLKSLPDLPAGRVSLDTDWVEVAATPPAPAEARERLAECLRRLHPWRKGPFRIHGLDLDAEWRSDRKWRRLEGSIRPLKDRLVLDVGCGNGYFGWRMVGAGARWVIGIDPTLLYVVQFLAVRHFLGILDLDVLPLALEDLPEPRPVFDTVFSMGVLYHRRSPLDHLLTLRRWLKPGGELVLETLVVEGGPNEVLVPAARYARMKNVWFVPSPAALIGWLRRCGFQHARLVDVTPTTPDEQRGTAWMRFQSLADSLDPSDPSRTLEGLPAPQRGIFLANP